MRQHEAQVREMFSRIAHGYDRANRWMTLGVDRQWRRRAVAGLLPADAADRQRYPIAGSRRHRVLDLCAGTLDSTLEIHRRYPEADIVAVDFSPDMLEQGRGKLTGSASRRVTVKCANAYQTGEPDNAFDAIFCAFGLRNLDEPLRATLEQARCLRPGGRLTVLEFFRPATNLTRAFFALYGRFVFPAAGWLATGDASAYAYLRRSVEGFLTLQAYRDLLQQNGFTDVRSRDLALGIASLVQATRV